MFVYRKVRQSTKTIKYKKIGELPAIVIDIVTRVAKEGPAIGEDTDDTKYAYKDMDRFKAALKKFVDNTASRMQNKDDRVQAASYQYVDDLPDDLQHLRGVVADKEAARRKKRKRLAAQKNDDDDDDEQDEDEPTVSSTHLNY